MTTSHAPTVAITGASGYLGGVIRDRMADAGWRTISLVRTSADERSRAYRIDDPPAPQLLEGVDALVHCAYDMTATEMSEIWRVNVEGSRRLLELARRSSVHRTIVLSSMSAFVGTRQLYGLAKLEIEDFARQNGAVVVRPGLVYGPRSGGMAGSLIAMTRLPVVPVVASRSHQFTVHEDDFSNAIAALLLADEVGSDPIGIANPMPVPFRDVIAGLAGQHGRSCRTIPVDWRLLHAALRIGERLGVNLPFRSDSLLGLANPAPLVPNLQIIDALGIRLRRFGQPTITSRSG